MSYLGDKELIPNNLKYILKDRKITMSQLAEYLKVTPQQVSKYSVGGNAMGIDTLTKVCKLLNCSPQQIYPQLDISGQTELIKNSEEKQIASNTPKANNIIVENYGFGFYVANFFKNITVVDFLTLNKKAILTFLVLMNIAFFTMAYLLSFGFDDYFLDLTPDARSSLLLNLAYGLDGILTGLMLPFLIRSWMSYTPLVMGLWAIEYPVFLLINKTVAAESDFHLYSVLAGALGITILYAVFVKYLRKNYLTDKGQN